MVQATLMSLLNHILHKPIEDLHKIPLQVVIFSLLFQPVYFSLLVPSSVFGNIWLFLFVYFKFLHGGLMIFGTTVHFSVLDIPMSLTQCAKRFSGLALMPLISLLLHMTRANFLYVQ